MNHPEIQLKIAANLTLPMKLQSRPFIATFESFQELSEVMKVNYIVHQKVTLENFRRFEEAQCFNFQKFWRCVKRTNKPFSRGMRKTFSQRTALLEL